MNSAKVDKKFHVRGASDYSQPSQYELLHLYSTVSPKNYRSAQILAVP